MSEQAKQQLPSWQRVKSALRSLGMRRALPGWLLGLFGSLWSLAETTHTTEFLLEKIMHSAIDPLWLVLVGIVWLAGVVIWAASRPSETEHLRAMMRLKQKMNDATIKFERLCVAYEKELADNGIGSVSGNVLSHRTSLMFSMAAILQTALDTLPEGMRRQYVMLLAETRFDFLEYHHHEPHSVFLLGDQDNSYPIDILFRVLAKKEREDKTAS